MTRKTLTLRNLATCAGLAVGMVTSAIPAMANNVVAISNGSFSTYAPTAGYASGTGTSQAGSIYAYSGFTGNKPSSFITGWNIATATPGSNSNGSGAYALGYLWNPNSTSEGQNLNSPYSGGFKLDSTSIAASPDGGSFIGIDGDAANTMAIYQTLTTIVGATYQVQFYQAGAQQSNQTGATTDYWQVGFNANTGGSFTPSTTALTTGLGATTYQNSATISVPSQGATAWQAQTLTFTATSTSTVLSFLAVGAPSVPPIVLLDGVSVTQITSTPEPSTIGLGLLAFGGLFAARRARNKRA